MFRAVLRRVGMDPEHLELPDLQLKRAPTPLDVTIAHVDVLRAIALTLDSFSCSLDFQGAIRTYSVEELADNIIYMAMCVIRSLGCPHSLLGFDELRQESCFIHALFVVGATFCASIDGEPAIMTLTSILGSECVPAAESRAEGARIRQAQERVVVEAPVLAVRLEFASPAQAEVFTRFLRGLRSLQQVESTFIFLSAKFDEKDNLVTDDELHALLSECTLFHLMRGKNAEA
jgi:hypothetical protein